MELLIFCNSLRMLLEMSLFNKCVSNESRNDISMIKSFYIDTEVAVNQVRPEQRRSSS